jgi:hypothetical protein
MPTTHSEPQAQIQRRRRELLKQMPPGGEILKGSLIERFTVCGRPGCRCQQGEKHGPYLYASVFDGKQSRQVYVPQSLEAEVRRWAGNYRRLSKIITGLCALSVKSIRLQQPGKRARSERQAKR